MGVRRKIKLVISYDGTRYQGWQIQSNGPSIQEEISQAIERVTGVREIPLGSGRTDSGVHALGQVAHFVTESALSADTLRRALNFHLPSDIVILNSADVPMEFHARKSAISKLYRYVFHDGREPDVFTAAYTWRVRRRLDERVMDESARILLGTHDFRCFETDWPNRKSSVRTITRSQVSRLGDFVSFDVESNGFLYNMVRAIAGSLALVGHGRMKPGWLGDVLRSGQRSMAGPNAPARGLFLVRVDYPAPGSALQRSTSAEFDEEDEPE